MRNRTLTGLLCIVLAIAVTFGLTPIVNSMTEGKTNVVRFTKHIPQGAEISKDNAAVVRVAKSALPDNCVKELKDIEGKFAVSDLFPGDFATKNKVMDNLTGPDNMLSNLPKNKMGISISVGSFASGFSGKLRCGDIVRIYVTTKDNLTLAPEELKYVRVITTTTADGIDENRVTENEDGSISLPSSVTLEVNDVQAKLLSGYEKTGAIHISFVCRDGSKNASSYLKSMDKYFENIKKGG